MAETPAINSIYIYIQIFRSKPSYSTALANFPDTVLIILGDLFYIRVHLKGAAH